MDYFFVLKKEISQMTPGYTHPHNFLLCSWGAFDPIRIPQRKDILAQSEPLTGYADTSLYTRKSSNIR
jgi:hypothetical protein